MEQLIDYCLNHKNIDDILHMPDVKERVDLYFEHEDQFKEQLQRCGRMQNNLVMLDLREEETIYAGNRFMIYAIFPESNISMHIMRGKANQNTVFAIGKSILNRTSKTHVGKLCLQYGGGGHIAAGTCQVPIDESEKTLEELVKTVTTDG